RSFPATTLFRSVHGGEIERRDPVAIARGGVRAGLEEGRRKLDVVVTGGPVQGRSAVGLRRVRVGLAEQRKGRARVARLRGADELRRRRGERGRSQGRERR